jgi:hypothetical protein
MAGNRIIGTDNYGIEAYQIGAGGRVTANIVGNFIANTTRDAINQYQFCDDGSDCQMTVEGNQVTNVQGMGLRLGVSGYDMDYGPSNAAMGTADVNVVDNLVGGTAGGIELFASYAVGAVSADISGNAVIGTGNGQAAIHMDLSDVATGNHIDIHHNRLIAGRGVRLSMGDADATEAVVRNNLILGVPTFSSSYLYVVDSNDVAIDFVHNTIVGGLTGLGGNVPAGQGATQLTVAENVVQDVNVPFDIGGNTNYAYNGVNFDYEATDGLEPIAASFIRPADGVSVISDSRNDVPWISLLNQLDVRAGDWVQVAGESEPRLVRSVFFTPSGQTLELDGQPIINESTSAVVMFVATNQTPGALSYRLAPGSGGVDAGDPAELDEDGSAADMGAYGGLDPLQ